LSATRDFVTKCVRTDISQKLLQLFSLRADGDIPIIMLTANGDEVDRVIGLEMGADKVAKGQKRTFSAFAEMRDNEGEPPCTPTR